MTGRCPIHGEYSAFGVCRWCEPLPAPDASPLPWVERQILVDWPVKADVVGEPPGASVLRDSKTLLDLAREWEAKHPILPQVEFLTQTNPFANEEPRVWHFYGFNEDGTIIHDWWEEIRLNEQHAALRWERVARRWNRKHGGAGGTEEGRAYVWRWWLEQMDRQSAGLPLAGPFPLGFYAW